MAGWMAQRLKAANKQEPTLLKWATWRVRRSFPMKYLPCRTSLKLQVRTFCVLLCRLACMSIGLFKLLASLVVDVNSVLLSCNLLSCNLSCYQAISLPYYWLPKFCKQYYSIDGQYYIDNLSTRATWHMGIKLKPSNPTFCSCPLLRLHVKLTLYQPMTHICVKVSPCAKGMFIWGIYH